MWESNDSRNTPGNDYDILHTVIKGDMPTFPPANPAWPVNSNAISDDGHDETPMLCLGPGGVLHCAWSSDVNLFGLTGTDYDIFQSTNATSGNAWSPMELLGLNGVFDGPGENDLRPQIVCAPNGIMSCLWDSNDDMGGAAGADNDIFHALGGSRGVTRPELVNLRGAGDALTASDEMATMAKGPDGVIHVVWTSDAPDATDVNHGNDIDLFHASLSETGWSAAELVNTNGISDTGKDQYPYLAIDSNNTLHVIWSTNSNIGGISGSDPDIYYSSNNGSGWTTPELVNSDGTTDGALGDEDEQPMLAIGSFGRVHAVWTSQGNSLASNISYSWRDESGWQPPEIVNHTYLNTVNETNNNPSLVVDRSGVPQVAWNSKADYNNAGSDMDIFYSKRIGGVWSDPEFINSNAIDDGATDVFPTIAIDSNSNIIYAVWSSDLNVMNSGTDYDIFLAQRQDGVWSDTTLLSTLGQSDPGDDYLPQILVDAGGGLHVVWIGFNNMPLGAAGTDSDLYYVNIPPDQLEQWPSGQIVILANATGYADATSYDSVVPLIVIDNEGYVNFAWPSGDDLGGMIGSDYDILFSKMNFPIPYTQSGARHWRRYR